MGGKNHDKAGVDAIEYFARQLEHAGYNYYGTETLYSGTGAYVHRRGWTGVPCILSDCVDHGIQHYTVFFNLDGVEMRAEIFFGIIHYQRLRHMVSDKFQVRSQGVVDMVTRQPLKGTSIEPPL